MGSGASAVANLNGLTFEGAAVSGSCAVSDIIWTGGDLAGGIESVLYDSQADWNVGAQSYKDVMGKPIISETIIMVPVSIISMSL